MRTRQADRAARSGAQARWTRLLADTGDANDGAVSPAPRSAHAMTLITPTKSVLLFGGCDNTEIFNDFYLLEPTTYASLSGSQASSVDDSRASTSWEPESEDATSSSSSSSLSLVWKRLVISTTPPPTPRDAPFIASSAGSSSDGSQNNAGDGSAVAPSADALPCIGDGRSDHTMHYVPGDEDEERFRGYCILVVGNIKICDDEDEASTEYSAFDMDELRVEEVRIRQPVLEAQWISRRVRSMWKPAARVGHGSVLVGDRLFCFGGTNLKNTTTYNDLFYFDVKLKQWQNLQPSGASPSARTHMGMAADPERDQIFLYGGFNGKNQFGGVFTYHIGENRWEKTDTTGVKPFTRMNHTLTFVNPHHVMLFGGRNRSARQNTVYLYNMCLRNWQQVDPVASSPRVISGSSSPTLTNQWEKASPSAREAQATVYYDVGRNRSSERILVFGGYTGGLKWSNELFLLEIPSGMLVNATAPTSNVVQSSQASQENATALSSQQSRSSSRSESPPNVLTDITNQTVSVSTTTASTSVTITAYTPAALAASKKKQKARALDSSVSSGTLSHSSCSLTSTSSSSQSQTQSLPSQQDENPQKKRRRGIIAANASAATASETQEVMTPRSQVSRGVLREATRSVGLQTTLIQMLQNGETTNDSLRVLMGIASDIKTSVGAMPTLEEVATLRAQNELLQQRLTASKRKIEMLKNEKREVENRLVAQETEAFVYKRHLEELMPRIGENVMNVLEQSSRRQNAAFTSIEDKLVRLHGAMDDMRNASGERTDPDDSPQKDNSIFPEDDRVATQDQSSHPLMYPYPVVRDLEEKLMATIQVNQELVEKLAAAEQERRAAEETSEHAREVLEKMARSKGKN
ncbi:hypothetical protein Poli38472_010612 [Pythium oligandrum]|uniref:Kelch repeat-containing protein n=1 Tax=Pythium oligandrum TaxID=41045 RepID=A0A8K1C3G8_PYTOL|nr:hypothetical protein Poli38472_010612 [Pythium oligandrum]|eukprot:TMW55730.1 hypothetical protein Poli38472_010612 [Pythium oligandrum]